MGKINGRKKTEYVRCNEHQDADRYPLTGRDSKVCEDIQIFYMG